MSLSEADLEKVASLAHLKLDSAHKGLYVSQLNSILDQVDTLNTLDLTNVSEMTTVVEQDHFQREDIAKKPGDLLLETNAPAWESGGFRVPKIV